MVVWLLTSFGLGRTTWCTKVLVAGRVGIDLEVLVWCLVFEGKGAGIVHLSAGC